MTITLDPVQLLIGAGAVLVALGLLARKVRQLDHVLHAAAAIVTRELKGAGLHDAAAVVRRELTPNGGESLKDDVTALTVAFGYLGRYVDQIHDQLEAHLERHRDEAHL